MGLEPSPINTRLGIKPRHPTWKQCVDHLNKESSVVFTFIYLSSTGSLGYLKKIKKLIKPKKLKKIT